MNTCSFCSAAFDQDHGVIGVKVGICHECSGRAANQFVRGLASDNVQALQHLAGEALCSFCYVQSGTSSALLAGEGQYICVECVGLIERDIKGLPFTPVEFANGTYPFPRRVAA